MDQGAYHKIVERSKDIQTRERSVAYLAHHLGQFLKKGERVLICFSVHEAGNLSWLMEQAVLRCDAVPVVWGPDRRWKALLRQAFSYKVSAIIGAPLIVLGLTKLARHSATPLSIRKVITAGYPCAQWMIDGIVKGFDCEMGGCFSVGETGVVAGFACGHSWGVHLRVEEYGVDIVDPEGNVLAEGELGEVVIYPEEDPALRYPMGYMARIMESVCSCGSDTPRLLDIQHGHNIDPGMLDLGQMLQSWTSILDCRLNKSECGLEIELVTFLGEKLPKLPTAAKLVVRSWEPEKDEPFPYDPVSKVFAISTENG